MSRALSLFHRHAGPAHLLLAVVLAVSALPAAQAAETSRDGIEAETVKVYVDQARLMRTPKNVGSIVIGNPLIADATLQPGGIMVVTGKGYGVTNMLTLDRNGNVISEKMIQVQGPRDNVVVVYRGVERESYSCTPQCERRMTLGDGSGYFEATLKQAGDRAEHAQSASAQSGK